LALAKKAAAQTIQQWHAYQTDYDTLQKRKFKKNLTG
jgi:hypothetical protein